MNPQALRSWRKRHNLTQIDAAKILGYSKTNVYRWESGDLPIPKVVSLACEVLDARAVMDQLEAALIQRHQSTENE